MIVFLEQVRLFVKLQEALWEALLELLSGDTGEFLSNVPRNGEVILNGVSWTYTKHGLGVCFLNSKAKVKVDFHRIESGAECFDAWGLSTYFGSLGNKGQKMLSEYGMKSKSHLVRITSLISDLQESSEVTEKGEAYELTNCCTTSG